MGKGRRIREKRASERPAHELLLEQADKLDKTAFGIGVAAVILTVLTLLLPAWSLSIISGNLANALYTAEETAALTPVLPLGQLSLVLTAVGVLAAAVCLRLRKSPLALIGLGVCLAAAAMLITFAVTLGGVFAYDAIEARGLGFWDLALRYYAVLLPTVMLIPAVCMSFVARKKRLIADVMQQASDTAPTLTLADETEETTQTQEDTPSGW